MVLPVILGGIGLGGLAVSTASNLYAQHNQRKLYRQQMNAYRGLNNGYERYLQKHGKSINPNRAWASYFGKAELARNNLDNSYLGSIGTLSAGLGAGAIGFRSDFVKHNRDLYNARVGRTSSRL